ncbi:hypothetical protein CO115_00680 [Candidatus Falkowbacteria bacterium CG_4_9_14_3_um_filter_36_9]|uniref:Uncharacterized protein n=2 Tax=Candidatus Falkowiibacteriota TaxID=1752728 RepID=A0A1J4TCB4_9BACT|nr:MAG: hypothetical protein AUJ27_01275 [Candidatus Falkowbacteria bacterium CG1_02_37_44]PIV50286.1 MAG: hypothetical protein COS18_05460 [Candidatus Falkowbacteria bacterium CG02_land_8_20_14_3_00_36_14]PIX11622.1 MAG: hypothetical protein COZ73_02130 [Candidatus Falkowbacteria bacterium CG_4_8_14_3_um_filter_36_11]PJA10459.1 MAG: hypothetical protein COX67_04550 [Candidatus Falkowbacteria bacterium CG_4_10_14_0_2_um_filter_36_22]PJB20741.1 MAG: hypothetical protein CO115_00680 [Candidatus F
MLKIKINKKKLIIYAVILSITVIVTFFLIFKDNGQRGGQPGGVEASFKFGNNQPVNTSNNSSIIDKLNFNDLEKDAHIIKDKKFMDLKDNSVSIDISNLRLGKDNPFLPANAASSSGN